MKEEEFQSKAHAWSTVFWKWTFISGRLKRVVKVFLGQRIQLENIMIRDLVEALNPDRDNDLIFQGIEILAPEKKKAIPKIRELSKEYQQEKDSARKNGGSPSSQVAKFRNFRVGRGPKVAERQRVGGY